MAGTRVIRVGAASTGTEMLSTAMVSRPDLVVLDVRMPSGGAAAANALHEASASSVVPVPAIVALTAPPSVSTVVAMLRAGARNYLSIGRVDPDPPGAEALRRLLEPGS